MSGDDALSWSVALWKRDPAKLLVIASIASGAGVLGLIALKSPFGFGLGFIMIALATADFWLPIHHRLDGRGATRKVGLSVSTIEWSAIVQVREQQDGVKLSPLESASSRLEAFRGVYLRFDGNREQVMERIRREVGSECKISGPKN